MTMGDEDYVDSLIEQYGVELASEKVYEIPGAIYLVRYHKGAEVKAVSISKLEDLHPLITKLKTKGGDYTVFVSNWVRLT